MGKVNSTRLGGEKKEQVFVLIPEINIRPQDSSGFVYGAVVTNEMQVAHSKVVRMALEEAEVICN